MPEKDKFDTKPIQVSRFADVEPAASEILRAEAAWNGIVAEKYRIPPLTHAPVYFEHPVLFLPLSGSYAQQLKNGAKLISNTLTGGDVSLFPSFIPHRSETPDGGEFALIHLAQSLLERAAEDSASGNAIELAPQSIISDPLIIEIGRLLIAEADNANLGGRLYAESLAGVLAVHLLRNYSTLARSVGEYKGGLPKHKLRRVVEYINANLDKELPLPDIAAVVEMNPHHLTRAFKTEMGLALHQYLMRQRIEQAKRLLAETELPIIDIALQVGFQDQSHFTKVFRRFAFVTPKAYRESR